ncbi:uncharacterized protein LOC100197237 [Hydra vulgaris]|uniref:Uncharacterized protein LOC100197237 n=1 Tax=Hydra vulgaris TaxID=6087 RepID=A0ABM4CCQ4_HYDVU
MIKSDQQDLLYCSNEDALNFYGNGDGLSNHDESIYDNSSTKFHILSTAFDFHWVYSENDVFKNDFGNFENAKNQSSSNITFQDFIECEESSSSDYFVDDMFDFGLSSSPESSTSDEWVENAACISLLSDKIDSSLMVLENREIISSLPIKEEYTAPECAFIDISSPVSEDSTSEDDFSGNASILISELLGLDWNLLPNKNTNFNVFNANLINENEILKSSFLDEDCVSKKLFSKNSDYNDHYFKASCVSNENVLQLESNYNKSSPFKKSLKTTEQKLRKRVQNRKAASRYRDRRKYVLGDIFNGAADLEKQNNDLKGKVSSLQHEINYLKNLMLDVIKARLSNKAC